MKFLLGIIIGIFGTLATTMITSTPAGSIWLRYVQTAMTGGVDHANAQREVSKNLFDPFTAQFDDLRTVSHNNREYVCGYVNAKNRMGAYIGKHQFVYDTLIGISFVDDGSDDAKALKTFFEPCRADSAKLSNAKKIAGAGLSNEDAGLKPDNPPALRPEDFPVSTEKSAPIIPPRKSASAIEDDHAPALSEQPPSSPITAWITQEERSKIDDSSNVFVSIASKDVLHGRYGAKGQARITIACREGKTNLWITFGGHFMSDYQFGTVTYRVDKHPAKKRHMNESTDHRALGLWSAGSAIPFAKELYGGERLFIEATPHSESAVTAEFDIAGLEQAIEPLAKACKWPTATAASKPKAAKPKAAAKQTGGPLVLPGH